MAVGLAGLTALATLSGPAQGAPTSPPGAVKGLHQAFQAAPYRGPIVPPPAASATAVFLAGRAPDAALVAATPQGDALVQSTSAAGNEDRAGDPQVASWRWTAPPASFRGTLELTWWWSSPTATLNDEVVAVAVIADAGTELERVIGRAEAAVHAGATPERNVTLVQVGGGTHRTVTVQVRPVPTSDSSVLRVHYGDRLTPSQVVFKAAAVTERQQNTPALYRGPQLEVQAHSIERDAAEPTIGIDADGVAFMAAGAFDALANLGVPRSLARTEIKRSKDGGKTWSTVQFTLPADLTTVPPTTLDPYVYLDEVTGRVFTPDLYLACNYLQFSDDKGESWTQSPVACGQPGLNDHQTVVTGPPPEGMQTLGSYPNFVYYCFNRIADASCGRSLDGGLTWLPAGQPAFIEPVKGSRICGSLHGHIITDNQGRLYLPKGHCGFPWLAISEDGAQTWRRVQVSDKFTSAGTHLSVDVDEAGTIYYLWWTAEERVPLLSHSTDGGDTWSAPALVAPPGVFEVNFPTIDAGKAGQVAISFPGTQVDRNDPDADVTSRPWNYYVMTSLNADTNSPLFVSTTAQPVSDPIHRGNCGPGRCAGMFDFLDVEYAPAGEIWATATDTCTAEAGCNTKDGTKAPSALGIAVRQLSGPGLSAPVVPPRVAKPPAAPAPGRPAPLPSTGVSTVLLWAAVAPAAAAAAVARRRRRTTRVGTSAT